MTSDKIASFVNTDALVNRCHTFKNNSDGDIFIKSILFCVSVKELRRLWTCPECKEPKHVDMVEFDSCDVWSY